MTPVTTRNAYPHRPRPESTSSLETVSDCCGVRWKVDQDDGTVFCRDCFNECNITENPHYRGEEPT